MPDQDRSSCEDAAIDHPSPEMVEPVLPEVSRPRADQHWSLKTSKSQEGGIVHFLLASLGAVGVVFGDIGTSPLYTFTGIFHELPGKPAAEDLTGAFSLIFWTITWVACLKYVLIVMRFSHHGEGGTFALMQKILLASEVRGGKRLHKRARDLVVFLGMLGCSLLIGDGAITPVISVLSAVEQVPVDVSPFLEVVLGIVVLLLLFLLQQYGSRMIGFIAGPVMCIWFLVIASLGLYNIFRYPEASWQAASAFNPMRLWHFFVTGRYRGYEAWCALAGVVLCVTGTEALYADMGHFGAGPITFAWLGLVYPSLVLQYFGQTAFLIEHLEVLEVSNGNPFRSSCPEMMRWPVAILSVIAAALASQALISGVFSLISQAHALGFLPRVLVLHTNPDERGQVYIPEVNYLLCIACVVLCITFGNSTNLGGAYGITVTGTFVVTTVLVGIATCQCWGWPLPLMLGLVIPMLTIDVLFWSSNMLKVVPGGWVPLAIAMFIWMVMHTYAWGRQREQSVVEVSKAKQIHELLKAKGKDISSLPPISSIEMLSAVLRFGPFTRSDTAAVFLTPSANKVPRSISAMGQSFRTFPKVIVLLSVQTEEVPFVSESERSEFAALDADAGLYSVVLHFGYAEPLTHCRLNVNARLECIGITNCLDYPDLNLLVSVDSRRRDSVQIVDSEMGFPKALAGSELEVPACIGRATVTPAVPSTLERTVTKVPSTLERTITNETREYFCTDCKGTTFILNKLAYFPLPGRSCARDLRVAFYSLLVRSARNPITFFGLEGSRTLEISSKCFM